VFLREALAEYRSNMPVMLDCDGQRPEAIGVLTQHLALVQVTLEGTPADSVAERAMETLAAAAAAGVDGALVLAPVEATTDGQLLRLVSRAHAGAPGVAVVVHPPMETTTESRRWLTFMEQATALHGDIRILARLPRPTGMR
jgi:hypothetical protein